MGRDVRQVLVPRQHHDGFNNHAGPVRATSRKYETRFYPAIFNNFAARMDWAKDGAGNRNPVVTVNGDSGLAESNSLPRPALLSR